uniref:Uncharacterized protein n=1 Tax=Lygus hesperus TaxID=30085 RepID=A0A0A9WYW8_LYGHE
MAVIKFSIFAAVGVLLWASYVLGFPEQQNIPKLTEGRIYSFGTGRAGQTSGLESGQVYGNGAGQAYGIGSGLKYEPGSGRGYGLSKTDGAQPYFYIPGDEKMYYRPGSGQNNRPGSGLPYWSASGQQSRLPGNGLYGPGSGQTYVLGSGNQLVPGKGQSYGIVSGQPRVPDGRERYGLRPGQTYGPGSHDVPSIFDPPPPAHHPWYKSFIDQIVG